LLGLRALELGPRLCLLSGLGPGRLLRNLLDGEADLAWALLLLPAYPRNHGEQHEHQQRFDRQGQAKAERAASASAAEPLDEGRSWGGTRLEHWVFGV